MKKIFEIFLNYKSSLAMAKSIIKSVRLLSN